MKTQRMTINGKYLVLTDPRNENAYMISHIGTRIGRVVKADVGKWYSERTQTMHRRLVDAVTAEVAA